MRELNVLVKAGVGRWVNDVRDEFLGKGIWEYLGNFVSIRIFDGGARFVDTRSNNETLIDFREILEIRSHLSVQLLSSVSAMGSVEMSIPMDFVSASVTTSVSVPLEIYSSVLNALTTLSSGVRD